MTGNKKKPDIVNKQEESIDIDKIPLRKIFECLTLPQLMVLIGIICSVFYFGFWTAGLKCDIYSSNIKCYKDTITEFRETFMRQNDTMKYYTMAKNGSSHLTDSFNNRIYILRDSIKNLKNNLFETKKIKEPIEPYILAELVENQENLVNPKEPFENTIVGLIRKASFNQQKVEKSKNKLKNYEESKN